MSTSFKLDFITQQALHILLPFRVLHAHVLRTDNKTTTIGEEMSEEELEQRLTTFVSTGQI